MKSPYSAIVKSLQIDRTGVVLFRTSVGISGLRTFEEILIRDFCLRQGAPDAVNSETETWGDGLRVRVGGRFLYEN